MRDLAEVVSYINNLLFVALAFVAFRMWRKQGGEAAAWVAATFASLAFIAIVFRLLPDESDSGWVGALRKLTFLGVVFFPYALYRFTTVFKETSTGTHRIVLGITVLVGLSTFLVDTPAPADGSSGLYRVYIVGVLLQWGGLLTTVAIRLWRAGRGQPTLARRRMRLLSLASVGMTLALIIGLQSGDLSDLLRLVVRLVAMASVGFFFLGFAPPALLRMAWRRPEQESLREATEELVRATTEEEVVDSLLPHVTRTLGARGALLTSSDGRTLGVHGDVGGAQNDPTPFAVHAEGTDTDVVSLEFDFGRLVIWVSPYTPFFGHEELELLRSLGVLTGLALDRTQLYQREQAARESLQRANRELQATNARLEESRAALAEAQSIAHIGSFAWDVAADRTAWSDELYAIFGADPGSFEVTSESYYRHVHPDDRQMVENIVAEAMDEKRPYSFDHRITREDGEQRILHARGKIETNDAGEPVRVVGTVQDVTAVREAEARVADALTSEREARRALEDLNADMESFVYTVSHDLNSPIIAIQGFADFLEKDHAADLPERGRFYIQRINASAGYLQSLIKDLLAFSRVGRVQKDLEPVDLGEVVRQACDEARAGCPNLQLHVGDLPVVYINPLRARQLFTNLIQNSCRYARRPDVIVTVSSEPVDGDVVSISVRDNGPGVPAEYRRKVFGVFERLHQEGVPEGTGMGLPICKRIVETTGGSMWIEDSDLGLDVRFTLPLKAPAAVEMRSGL